MAECIHPGNYPQMGTPQQQSEWTSKNDTYQCCMDPECSREDTQVVDHRDVPEEDKVTETRDHGDAPPPVDDGVEPQDVVSTGGTDCAPLHPGQRPPGGSAPQVLNIWQRKYDEWEACDTANFEGGHCGEEPDEMSSDYKRWYECQQLKESNTAAGGQAEGGALSDLSETAMEGYDTYTEGREAPQAGYVDLAPAALAEGVTLGPITEAEAAQLGDPALAGKTTMPPAALSSLVEIRKAAQATSATVGDTVATGAAQVAPTAVTQAAQVGSTSATGSATIDKTDQDETRRRQLEFADYLTKQGTGEGSYVADAQWAAATDRNLAQQQALAASARGGDAAMAARGAAQNVSAFGQQAAQQATIGKLEEQSAARAQLGELITSARASDVGLASTQAQLEQIGLTATAAAENASTLLQAQLNQEGLSKTAAAQNATAMLQAQLEQQGMNATAAAKNAAILMQAQMEQQTNIFNTAEINAFSLAQAQLAQQTNLANQAATNTQQLQQGAMDQQVELANQAATNTFTIKQGEFEQEINITNAQADNLRKLQQGTLDQQTQLANQNALNSHSQLKAQLDQGVNLANLHAQLTQTGLDDGMAMAHLKLATGMSIAQLQADTSLQIAEIGQPSDPGFWDYAFGLLETGIDAYKAYKLSDKRRKEKLADPSEEIDAWLDNVDTEESGTRWDVIQSGLEATNKIRKTKKVKQTPLMKGIKAVGSSLESYQKAAKEKSKIDKKNQDKRDKAYEEQKNMSFQPSDPNLKYSDVNLKKDIEPGEENIDDFLSKITPYKYEYKDPEVDGEGEFISPMAQDLEKSEAGKNMVIETPRGKMVDYQQGLGTIVAALAHLDKKIKELEGKKKGKR